MTASIDTYRRLLAYVRPYLKVVGLSVLSMAAAAALEPVMPALLKPLIDHGLARNDSAPPWRLPLLLLAAFTGKSLAEYVSSVASQWVAFRSVATVREQVFEHQTALPLAAHQQLSHGKLLSRILNDVPLLGAAMSTAWITIVRDTLIVICLGGYLLWTSWQLTLLILVIAPFVALIIRAAGNKLRGSSGQMQALTAELAGQLESAVVGVKEIKVFGARAYESERFDALSQRLRKATMRMVRVQAANVPMVQVLAAAAVAVVIYSATALPPFRALTAGGFASFVAAMSMLFEPIRRLTSVNGTIQSGLAAAEGIFALLDTPREPEGTGRPVPPAPHGLPVTFRGVSFHYPGQEAPALRDFDLALAPGTTVALVGASGSGKTTVANLLARFHEPASGQILYGDEPIGGLELAAWRRQLAWVGQQVVLFDDSVAANIAYGRKDIPREDIERAARAAHAWEFIQRMPQGLDSPCGHNGSNLSGGQRQRIAIARAFLKDAPLLILDEATSALDNESERQVQEALQGLMRERTTLVIAHRLSTIEHADLIVVMEAGRVVETGRHAELMARGGAYSRLHRTEFAEPAVLPVV